MYQIITTSGYTFEKIREGNLFYADKTDFFHQLVSEPVGVFFMSRPRRFGKSLSVSILNNIFKGKRSLFEGLKIYDMPYDWKSYPVVNLNISKASCESVEVLNRGLCLLLHESANELGLQLSDEKHAGYLFAELLTKAKDLGQVVVLIDEYDKPLVENIAAPHIAEIRQLLENFYINLKAYDEHLRFVFMTGVTKFSKVSVFSKLNNLRDISMSKAFATMYGYTQKEVERYFGDRINTIAKQKNTDKKELRATIQKWYNGFRFHQDADTVYNPVSLGLFLLENGEFSNYWFSTGNPTFIFKILKEKKINFFENIAKPIDLNLLDTFDDSNLEPASLLLQTGYLTIDYAQTLMGNKVYYLRFPNFEIEMSFNKHLLSALTQRDLQDVSAEISQLQLALLQNNTANLRRILTSHIASIPYSSRSDREENYQNIIYSVFRLLGAEIHNEVHINNGRIDSVIVNKNNIYIFEFKINQSADQAIAQIIDKGYATPYLNENKPITLIGINFSSTERNIVEWKEEYIHLD